MSEGLFNPEAFEQMPGQMSMEQVEDERARRLAEYEALRRVAVSAAVVLETEGSRESLTELAQAMKAADWGDWSARFPGSEA